MHSGISEPWMCIKQQPYKALNFMCRYDKDKLPDELIDAYRMPQLVRGWEDGLIRFFLARVSGGNQGCLVTQAFIVKQIWALLREPL